MFHAKNPLFFIPVVLIIIISALVFFFNPSTIKFVSIELKEGKTYSYYVDCVDFCGDKQWDATEVDGKLFFKIQEKIDEKLVITTSYNSSTPIERTYTDDYGNFTYNESFNIARYNELNNSYAWQFVNQKDMDNRQINISLPWMFVPHAPQAFKSNIIPLNSDMNKDKVIEIDRGSIKVITFTGKWVYSYFIQSSNVTVTADIEVGYEFNSGIMVEIEIAISAVQEFIGDISLDPNYEAVDSFKANLLL